MKLVYRKEALKTLTRMPRPTALLIRDKVEALAENPYTTNNNVKALEGVEGYRLRVGDWRVIYRIDGDVLEVLRIAPRGGVYK